MKTLRTYLATLRGGLRCRRLALLSAGWAVAALLTTGVPVSGALKAVGPLDPVTTLPAWYQDPNNLALQPCTDQNGFCILTPLFDPALTNPPNPITTSGPINDTNYPDELFYFLADATMNVNGDKAVLRLALEAAFLAGVTPNSGITFLRVNLQRMVLTPNSTYTVTHPYGSFQFATDGTGRTPRVNGQAFRVEDPITPAIGIYFPPDLQGGTLTHIGPFLRRAAGLIVDPVSGNTYLGDPGVAEPITGSPTGNNFFRIDGPNIGGAGINTVQTNLFNISGKVFTGQIPTPLTLDRTTYARDAASGQIDLFVSALSGANLTASGTGLAGTTLTEDSPNSGKFFAHLPFGATLPTGVKVTNNLDVPPVVHPVVLVDEVQIQQAIYDPNAKTLTIKAASRDQAAPLPVLTVAGLPVPNTLDSSGTLAVSLTGTIPPELVTVVSSKGGAATVPVSVAVPPPVAADDAAAVGIGGSVTVNVLANDSARAPAALDPGSVVLANLPSRGTALVDPSGAITYTASGLSAGSDSFTYTVRDSNLQRSNPATVLIAIVGSGPAPVAGNDSATAPPGSTVTINVVGNDSATAPAAINPASLKLTNPTGGSASANANGTVSYTAPAVAGSYVFSYTVQDTAAPPVTSNPATVTVSVGGVANVPPVAGNDSAATTVGSTMTINVLTNDNSVTSTLNPASLALSAPSGGSATANPNGTVSYTAPAVAGTYSFTYTVQDNATPPATSNAATVTVTVSALFTPPAAVNDTASTSSNSAVTINVLANDRAGTNPLDSASVSVASPAANGTAAANPTGTITYTPTLNFAGNDSFTYTVKDAAGNVSNAATVTLSVTALQTIAVSRAQFTLNGATWRVDGTMTPAPPSGTTLTIYNNPTVGTAALTTTVPVSGNGSWTWSSPNNAPQPNAQRKISVGSNQNASKVEQVTVTVR